MKRILWLAPWTALLGGSCNNAGFDAVSIRPIYGWAEGCGPVRVSGHGFGDDVTVSLGDGDVATMQVPLESPTVPSDEVNKGFYVEGVMPASPGGGGVYADVIVTTGGQTDVIEGAFYYVACPGVGYVEGLAPSEGLLGGETVSLSGCGLDAAGLQAWLVDGAGVPAHQSPLPLTSICRTASVSFTAPALPAGAYYLLLTDLEGNPVSGGAPDTGDTAALAHALVLSFGGAR